MSWIESSEEELWTTWLAPDYPRDSHCSKPPLNSPSSSVSSRAGAYWSKTGKEVVTELDRTRLPGRCDSAMSSPPSEELPAGQRKTGSRHCLKTHRTVFRNRYPKTDPRLFLIATKEVGVAPGIASTLATMWERRRGSQIRRIRMTVLILPKKGTEDFTDATRPDAVIHAFSDLLKLFPGALLLKSANSSQFEYEVRY